MALRIGVDFDNTLIDYRKLFWRLATEGGRGWIPAAHPQDKERIRETLIATDGDDRRWQRLQAEAYGPRILEAKAYEGAREFVRWAREAGHEPE